MSELLLELLLDPGEQGLLIEALGLHERRGAEEGAHESRSLHPVPEVRIGGLLGGDLEGVHREDLDVLFLDDLPRLRGQGSPQRIRLVLTLDHEHAARLHAGERVRILEHVRVGRQHHVHELELAVQAQRLARQDAVERGGLSLLLRAVLRICLDVEAGELERGEYHVLAHRDRSPAAYRVDAE